MDRKTYAVCVLCSFLVVIMAVWVKAAVPVDTLRDTNDVSTLVIDHLNVTDTYWFTHGGITYNLSAVVVELLNITPVNEWGLVYGSTGDWFNYTILRDATPVYIGLQMHPLNLTIGGEYVIPQVYDKDDTHWQLELVWMGNGTQCTKDCLVMYYAHIDWSNPDGLTYILPSGEEPL